MDYLFVELMLWGRQEGYQWFNLGMAPLAGLENRTLAPLWSKAGALLFRHGEHFYNFQGLRQYKDKFDPEWRPKYLACRGGLALPRVLTNVATLISGGLGGIVKK
jgi:phosphatidylglycerol lysyltransferase